MPATANLRVSRAIERRSSRRLRCTSSVSTGCAVRPSSSETAIPMRLVPISSPKKRGLLEVSTLRYSHARLRDLIKNAGFSRTDKSAPGGGHSPTCAASSERRPRAQQSFRARQILFGVHANGVVRRGRHVNIDSVLQQAQLLQPLNLL